MAWIMFVCSFKTDELNQILMRRSLAKLKQAACLLSGFFSFFWKLKSSKKMGTKQLQIQSVLCSYLKGNFKITQFLMWL